LRIADCNKNAAEKFRTPHSAFRNCAAFTMIEIALCLAIIGFALVSILLVLPSGMNTQRDTREETIIGQDASMLLEAIRNGSRGLDDLTNNVYAITNYFWQFNLNGTPVPHTAGYTRTQASVDSVSENGWVITNGLRIVGLLSTPEFLAGGQPIADISGRSFTSNHIVAYVRSFSGLVAEKPPQDNQIMQEDAFSYRVLCVNAPMAMDTNAPAFPSFMREQAANVRDLRLTFLWPQLPNGNVGGFRQTFRAGVGGQMTLTNDNGLELYFYQPQSFSTNAP
jgi:type II secretory pathway pseudopilin PulG